MEGDQRAGIADIDLGNIRLDCLVFDLDQPDQIGGRCGQIAEAVDHFGGQGLDLALVARVVETAVERHPHRQIGNIVLGDHDRRVDSDLRADAVGFGI